MCCGDFCFIVFFVVLTKVRILCEHWSLFNQRGCQMAKTLTSFHILPFGVLRVLHSPFRHPHEGEDSMRASVSIWPRGSQIAKMFTSFHILPFGLAWASLKSRPKSVMFASLSTDFVELTSSVHLAPLQIHKEPPLRGDSLCIGVARFELTTFCSQSRRSTRLSYTPKCSQI